MSVTERLMASGSWNLTLDRTTPKATRDLLLYFGHVFTFDSPMRAGLSDTAMLATSRWGGVLRRRQTPWQLSGTNMISWLGDEDGKGPLLEAAVTKAASTFATWVTSLLPAAVALGTVTAGGATVANTYGGTGAGQTPITPRAAIDNLASICGFEYRVTKSAVFDADVVGGTGLFKQTPTAAAIRRSSGRDLNITGLPVTQLDVAIDSEEYITRSLVHHATGYAAQGGAASPYKDLLGNALSMTKLFESTATPTANGAAQATNLVNAGQVLRNQVTLGSDEFDINRDVVVGDYIWVYDEDGSMVDTTNQVRYRGSVIFPLKLRVLAITWPIERGMGVWYRSGAGVWTDLTNYVLFESPGVSFEVGAATRALLTKP